MSTTNQTIPVPEQWRAIPGYDGLYDVSDLGRVRSHLKSKYHKRRDNVILMSSIDNDGYPTYALYLNGKLKRFKVSVLVLLAFRGPRPVGMHCCHGDGNKENNFLSNLRYDTPKANEADKRTHGRNLAGERHHATNLSVGDIVAIRASDAPGVELSKLYGVTPTQITRIRLRKSWRHVS